MQKNLFTQDQVCNSNLAEIEIKYSTRVKPSEMEKVVTSHEAYEILKKIYPSLEHREYFYMLCLNRNNKVLGYSLISMGGLSGTVVDVRIIFQTALKASACSIILSHYAKKMVMQRKAANNFYFKALGIRTLDSATN